MSPTVVIGLNASKAAVAVVCPVPPEAIGSVPVVKALVDVAYNAPPEVKLVNPVPPLVVAKVPASVTAPVVAVFGVNPVVPALNELTKELEIVPHDGADPVLPIKTWPVVPAGVTPNADVPLPYTIPLAVNEVTFVPPAATGNVPAVKTELDVEYNA